MTTKPLPKPPPGVGQLHCCACLNVTGKQVVAVGITHQGYLLCADHLELTPAELRAIVWDHRRPAAT